MGRGWDVWKAKTVIKRGRGDVSKVKGLEP